MEKECYEDEVHPYRKTDYKPIIIINYSILHIFSDLHTYSSIMLLLFAMIRSVVKSFKVPDVEVAAARMSNESALTRTTYSTPKNLGQTGRWSWMDELTLICQMNYLLLGGSTTRRRESLILYDTYSYLLTF